MRQHFQLEEPAGSSHGAPIRSYEGFVASLQDKAVGPTALSPKGYIAVLQIDLQTLADQAHVHRNTVARAPGSVGIQRFLREALRVLRAASDFSGDFEKALFWYRNDPLPGFSYKTPEKLVSEGRADDVLNYIESLQAGAVG